MSIHISRACLAWLACFRLFPWNKNTPLSGSWTREAKSVTTGVPKRPSSHEGCRGRRTPARTTVACRRIHRAIAIGFRDETSRLDSRTAAVSWVLGGIREWWGIRWSVPSGHRSTKKMQMFPARRSNSGEVKKKGGAVVCRGLLHRWCPHQSIYLYMLPQLVV